MDGKGLTRRSFVAGSGASAVAALSRLGMAGVVALGQAACEARDSGAAFKVLQPAEARELEAITARILPTTETPGALEAGVIRFMDHAFASFMEAALPALRAGLEAFQQSVPIEYPGARAFSGLDVRDQDRYLKTRDDEPFFGMVRVLTLAGFLGMSSYGGNRDHVGWKLLGLDPGQHAHQYPFGWYDAHNEQNESHDA